MNQSLPVSESQLLALVKASLWQREVDEKLFSSASVDWQGIGRLALQQTVGVLVFEAALSLPENLRPPKEWRQRALAFIEMNRRTQLLVDRCAAEVVTKLNEERIKSVLLKGQAYARAYPGPEMRQCGDIDLYVGTRNYHAASEAVKRFGWESEENFSPKAKHYGCSLHGVRIELHRVAAVLTLRNVDNKFQKWSSAQINSSNRYLEIADVKIPVPTALFDIVFVFLHLYNHFIKGGIGLRHVCDWTMLLHAHANDINIHDLEDKLKEFGLMRAWKMFAPIAVDCLGLPETECPFYSAKYEKGAGRVLSFILKEGNFGRARKAGSNRPDGYFPGKIYALRRLTKKHIEKITIDPKTVILSFSKEFAAGAYHTLRDIMKGKCR